jgi:hypothetical protein
MSDIEYARKANVFTWGGAAAERREVLAQARDQMEQAAEIQTLCLSYVETEHHAAADAALRHYAGVGLKAGDIYGKAKELAPHTRWALLVELRAIGRAQTASDEAWRGMEQSGAEMLARKGLL